NLSSLGAPRSSDFDPSSLNVSLAAASFWSFGSLPLETNPPEAGGGSLQDALVPAPSAFPPRGVLRCRPSSHPFPCGDGASSQPAAWPSAPPPGGRAAPAPPRASG